MATTQASLFDFGEPDNSGKQEVVQREALVNNPESAPQENSEPTPSNMAIAAPILNGEVHFEEAAPPLKTNEISDEELLAQNYISDDFLPVEDIEIKKGETSAELSAAIEAVKNPQPASPERKSTRGRMKLSDMNTGADLIEIPDDEELFQKSYYPIGAVSEMFKVNISLIRFWENEFDILKPRKNGKGDRHFRPEDVKNLKLIYHLLREKKYTIEGAKDFLKKNKKVEETFSVIESLKKMKAFLNEIRASL